MKDFDLSKVPVISDHIGVHSPEYNEDIVTSKHKQ